MRRSIFLNDFCKMENKKDPEYERAVPERRAPRLRQLRLPLEAAERLALSHFFSSKPFTDAPKGVLEAHASSVNSRESETPKRPRRRDASTCAKGLHAPDAPRHAEQHGPLLSVCY